MERFKKIKLVMFVVGCFFGLSDTSFALSMTCPEVVSPGEEIKVHLEEGQYNGIKARYSFADGFVYQRLSLNSSWKSYYDWVEGFGVGNVSNQEKLVMDIWIKVGMDIPVNKDYTLALVNVEGNDSTYKYVNLDSLSCVVKVLSDVNTLDSLRVGDVSLSPSFDKNVTSYKGTTKRDSIVIEAVASDSGARVEGDVGEQKLNVGANTFVVRVVSARGNVKEYKLYITRTIDKKSSDVTLKSLSISQGKIDFKKDTFLYLVDVNYEVERIEVEGSANDSKAKVEIEKPEVLVVGENVINVIVTSEDGTKATYVIVVNRKDKLSGDATIRELKVKNYDINFSSDVYEYELEIDNEDSLDIEVTLNDDKAKYKISGNEKLKDNSVIEIEVTAENGDIKTYQIRIRKPGESNSKAINNYVKIIPVVLCVGLILGVLIIKVLKKKVAKS